MDKIEKFSLVCKFYFKNWFFLGNKVFPLILMSHKPYIKFLLHRKISWDDYYL